MKIIKLIFFSIILTSISFFYIQYVEQDRIIFIDVGQGDATYARLDGADILIDSGPNRNIIFSLGKIMPIYDKKIEYLIITHFDQDHIGGISELVNRYEIGMVIMEDVCQKQSCEEIKRTFIENNIPVNSTKSISQITITDTKINFLYPRSANINNKEENDKSIISCISAGTAKILITGDASVAIEQMMLEADKMGECADVDVLHAGHHGSKTASSLEFITSIRPEYAILSSGKDNRYGHPHFEVLERFKQSNIQVLRTDELGNISYNIDTKTFY